MVLEVNEMFNVSDFGSRMGRMLRAPNRMPREPRCDKNGLNARKGDEAVPGDGTARSPEVADAHSCRNPKGRGIFCRMPALLGLDDPSPRVVVALPPWPAPESAASRPRGILLGALSHRRPSAE